MDYEGLLELVKKRRSIRSFKPEPIHDEYIDKIIEVARWASSGANSQPWEFIVVKKPEIKEAIVQLIKEQSVLNQKMELTREPELRMVTVADPSEQPGYMDAPVFIILCGDTRTQDAYPLSGEPQRKQTNFDSSLANAFLHMHLAATTLGLASQWVSVISYRFVQLLVKNMLGIPKELEIYDMMALGYTTVVPRPRLVRTKEELVHYDYYNKAKFRTAEEIRDFIVTLRRG
ncbi:nitroreductase family protein [Chloroflexota bacterium]